MIYIKKDSNNIVTLGGQVANTQMLEEGYFEYNGEIPAITNTKHSQLVFDGTNVVETFDEIKLEDVKKEKLESVTKDYEAAVATLVGEVGNFELASWSKQEQQARAYLNDNTAIVPMLSSLIASRGLSESLLQLSTLIVAKADAYELGYSTILGEYQAKVRAIAAATLVSDALSVPSIDHTVLVTSPII
jgi:hypothetical protein